MVFIQRSLAELQEGNYSDQYASQSEHDKGFNHGLFCCLAEYGSAQELSLSQHFQCYQILRKCRCWNFFFFWRKTWNHLCTCALPREWNNFWSLWPFCEAPPFLVCTYLCDKDHGPDCSVCLALRFPLCIVKGWVIILTTFPVMCTVHQKDTI